jgi:hypothetical protein
MGAAVTQWWEGELERGYALREATCLHKAYTTRRDMPTSQVPTFLETRVAAGHALPRVEVVMPHPEECQGDMQIGIMDDRVTLGYYDDTLGAEAEGEERHAVLEYVVNGLNEALVTEFLEGFH